MVIKNKKVSTKKSTSKKVVVNRKFMTDLADKIYNPKTRKFLHLCNGKLQNGPDPTNSSRPMHCGLGELYFAMTGRQPEQDSVGEEDVIEMAMDLSTIKSEQVKKANLAIDNIKKLKLSEDLTDDLIKLIEDAEINFNIIDGNFAFRYVLDEIPNLNDKDECKDIECDIGIYRERSRRVAAQLRKAAKMLPS